ncbi:MAG: SUMF1/EgtB/PvdO family nonheme iron enzyme [Chloroflexi bacterium]|nr:SUMF1/EgtB/PvdO family nonheme iron enzyme [Chloroflexota bacterium]
MTEAYTLPLLEWLDIPAGTVTLVDGKGTFDVQPFRIAKYAVTNAQFDAFISDGGYSDTRWWADAGATELDAEQQENGMSTWQTARERFGTPQPSHWPEADCPRTDLCWYEAVAFCRWLAHKTGLAVRLPTEWEWQWAAVGATGWEYPYGAEFDALKCNTYENGIGRTVPVTAYADVSTVHGTVSQSGNVLEWCSNEFENTANLLVTGTGRPAMRGGSWGHDRFNGRAIHRFGFNALNSSYAVGIRVMCETR